MANILKSVIRGTTHTILQPFESSLLKQSGDAYTPPVFIIGAPRSGTSLLYELMVTNYKFSYFSNLANIFYKSPLAVSYFGKMIINNWEGSSKSNYGTLQGLGAPSEAGAIWGRWIPEFHYLDQTVEFKQKFFSEAPAIINGMQKIFSAPFINKNVMHSVHMKLLDSVFPGCIFIDIRRDDLANVRSIINAKAKGGGPKLDSDGWWSVKPRGAEKYFGLSPEEQACAQISLLRKDIEDSVNYIGHKRYLMITYEDVCGNTEQSLSKIKCFIEQHCGKIIRNDTPVKNLRSVISNPLSDESEEIIKKSLLKHGLK